MFSNVFKIRVPQDRVNTFPSPSTYSKVKDSGSFSIIPRQKGPDFRRLPCLVYVSVVPSSKVTYREYSSVGFIPVIVPVASWCLQ